MYTRSFPSRRMPPDYGGTALVIGSQHQDEPRAAITDPTADRRIRRLEAHQPTSEDTSSENAPFGIFGQEGRDTDAIAETVAEAEAEKTVETASAPLISLERLKSDDLLLLGLALLLFTDKEGDGGIPTDALLILAILFFSGL